MHAAQASDEPTAVTQTTTSRVALETGYLTEAEAAEYLGIAKDTLRVYRAKSRAAKALIGPRWTERGRIIRYRRVDLDAWLDGGLTNLQPAKRVGRPRKEARP